MSKSLSRWRDSAPVLLLLLLLLTTACATASGVRLGLKRYPPEPSNEWVPIFESLRELPRGYERVARIVGEGSDLASFEDIVAKMQTEARELGGNALVLTGGGLLLLKGTDFGVDTDRTVHALAVRLQPVAKKR